jgi:hypothetical protein
MLPFIVLDPTPIWRWRACSPLKPTANYGSSARALPSLHRRIDHWCPAFPAMYSVLWPCLRIPLATLTFTDIARFLMVPERLFKLPDTCT